MKYSLRSLMIAAILGPPLLAGGITIATRFLTERESQTLPEPWPPGGRDEILDLSGPEFNLAREAAAKKRIKQELKESEEPSP
ncbi:MAG: hypothetical protein ACKVP0_03760 [Pirellulaceae bacterium]